MKARTILRQAVYNAQRRNTYLMERRIHAQLDEVKKAKDKTNLERISDGKPIRDVQSDSEG